MCVCADSLCAWGCTVFVCAWNVRVVCVCACLRNLCVHGDSAMICGVIVGVFFCGGKHETNIRRVSTTSEFVFPLELRTVR